MCGLDIDAPWLADGALLINGVDVVPLVEAELNRRFPGRELKPAKDPDGLRTAWAALEQAWAASVDRVEAMPEALPTSQSMASGRSRGPCATSRSPPTHGSARRSCVCEGNG